MATKNPSKTSDLPNGYVSKGGADGWDSRDSNHTTPSYMVANPKAMHVRVHANREQFEPGKKITVATNKTKNFENFLDECTEKVKPPWGAARRLYTARGRRRIQSLDELEEGSIYVITGNEKFKRCNYREISENSRGRIPRRIKGFKKIDIDRIYTPVQHAHSEQLRRKSGRSYSLGQKFIGLFLKVHINGKTCPAAHVVSIRPQKRTTRVDILDQVADDMNIQPGSIKWVFRIHNEGYGGQQDFELIHEAEEFQSNDHILVVPAPQKPLFTIYQIHGKPDISVKTSPRSDYIGQPYSHHKQGKGRNHDKQGKDRNKSGETSLNKFKPLPSIGSSKQSESRSPFSNAGSQGGRRNNQKSRARQVDYDKDHNNGVYHAKKQNNSRGAQQVNETRDTRTEKPLDQMEAEIVTEERVDEDAGMQHNDEFGDDSFNQYDSNTPGGRNKDMRSSTPVGQNKDMRSSTPASRGESRQMRQQKENEAAVRIQAATKGYQTRKKFNAEKESLQRQKDERNQRQQEENDRRRQEEEDEYRRREADAQQNSQQKGRDEDLAASKIQASFKGYKTRKDLKTKQQVSHSNINDKSKNMSETDAAVKIQSGFKGYKVRKEYKYKQTQKQRESEKVKETDINDNDEKDKRYKAENEAATKIQSNYRGYKTRKEMASKKSKDTSVDNKKMNEDAAAVRIQAGFKGYKTRKDLAVKKSEKSEVKADSQSDEAKKQQEAATKIQSSFRGHKVRKNYSEKKKQNEVRKEEEAATRIQASFKGYTTRKQMATKKKEQLPDPAPSPKPDNTADLDKAATKIQSGFRGYKTRKEFKSKGQK